MTHPRFLRGASLFSLISVCLLVLSACNDKPANSISGPGPQIETVIYPFSIVGNTIAIEVPQEIDRWSYCFGDSLIEELDTFPARTQYVPFEFVTDRLLLTMYSDQMQTSGATVELLLNLTRMSGGSGLEGTWTMQGMSYRVKSGTPTAEEIAELNANIAEMQGQMNGTMTFSGATVTVSTTVQSTFADDFIESWNQGSTFADSAQYAVTVTKISSASVELTGQKSGEKVTITEDGDGNETFTSSVSANKPHTYYMNPVSCPNDDRPDWFETFLAANPKSGALGKRAAPAAPKAPQSRHLHGIFGTWKNRN